MEEEHIPILIKLMFGEQAGLGAQGASERLRRWWAAFEAWQGTFPESRKQQVKAEGTCIIIIGSTPPPAVGLDLTMSIPNKETDPCVLCFI